MTHTILIIDDDAALRAGLAEAIADLGHKPVEAAGGAAGLELLARQKVAAVLLDLRMPGMDGLEVLRRIRELPAPPPVAVLTAVPTAANTIEAMRLGAVDHIEKPIGRAALSALIARMLPTGATAPQAEKADPEALIGNAPAMREVQKAIGMLADADTTVLITGETGTGKEVVARAIHRHGRRGDRPFVAVNCAAIPADLLESHLFGHVRGAFTGAIADRQGSFREADGGTLFLDEIGDMAPALQAKLLRVLQDRVVVPVGGKPIPVDVRILAATHQDLAALVAANRFREDLFWRLGVVPLRLPPLRERLSDILPLAEHFLALVGRPPRSLSPEAGQALLAHPWPGNVRELRNAMERVTALARRPVITAEDLSFLHAPATAASPEVPSENLPDAVARLEAAMIRAALEATGGNRTETAKRLNIHRQLLYEKMRRYGLGRLGMSDSRTGDVGNADAE